MLNYTGDADVASASSTNLNKFAIPLELFAAFYVFGIVGSVLASLHLFQKQKFRNTKQIFLLKCLMMFDFVGMMGMLTQMTIRYHMISESLYYRDHTEFFCFVRTVWRFLGYFSGCVAFIMAIDRYFSLTRPFFYCQHFTNGFVKKLLSLLFLPCAALCFAPAFGIGFNYDDIFVAENCVYYRKADHKEQIDAAYAVICLLFVSSLCFVTVLCNFFVTRIVNRSYRNMKQLTMSCLNDKDSSNRNQKQIEHSNRISAVSSGGAAAKSILFVTSDEIKFINMCNLLTASFVICWEAQIITKMAQFVKNANQSKFVYIYYQIADILLLFHFTMDPYIYVLLRTNYWSRLKIFVNQLLFKKDDEFAEISRIDQ